MVLQIIGGRYLDRDLLLYMLKRIFQAGSYSVQVRAKYRQYTALHGTNLYADVLGPLDFEFTKRTYISLS